KEGGPAPIQNSARASESCCSGSLCVPQVSASGCADRCRAKRGGRMAAVSVAAAGEAGVVALTDEPPSASGAAADRAAELDDSAAPGGHLEPVLASRADRAGARGPAPAGVPRRAGALPRVAGAEPWRMAPRSGSDIRATTCWFWSPRARAALLRRCGALQWGVLPLPSQSPGLEVIRVALEARVLSLRFDGAPRARGHQGRS
ncbi:unnamed protein product, partial [Prorocentrum cordatum]